MRYPHTYSLLVITSIFLMVALSGCTQMTVRTNTGHATLPELPASIITVTPQTETAVPARHAQADEEEKAEQNAEPAAGLPANEARATSPEQPPLAAEQVIEIMPEQLRQYAFDELVAPVYFDFDAYNISVDDTERLAALARYLQQAGQTDQNIRIEGHCDDRGTREYNFALGERRAAVIARILMNNGVGQSRIMTISYGKERPAVLGMSEEARARNRRGDLIILPQ